MMKASSWRRATTPAYTPSRTQALASLPSRTKTKARRRTFCVEDGGRKCRTRKKISSANRLQKSSFKPVESDQFQIGPRSLSSSQARPAHTGNGYGTLLAFELDGRPLGAFSDDSRIADPRGLAADRDEGLLFLEQRHQPSVGRREAIGSRLNKQQS